MVFSQTCSQEFSPPQKTAAEEGMPSFESQCRAEADLEMVARMRDVLENGIEVTVVETEAEWESANEKVRGEMRGLIEYELN